MQHRHWVFLGVRVARLIRGGYRKLGDFLGSKLMCVVNLSN